MPENDAVALADAMTALLADPARRAALGNAARADVSTRLTWARTALAFEQVYRAACAARQTREG